MKHDGREEPDWRKINDRQDMLYERQDEHGEKKTAEDGENK
jgi:hypothetical protein